MYSTRVVLTCLVGIGFATGLQAAEANGPAQAEPTETAWWWLCFAGVLVAAGHLAWLLWWGRRLIRYKLIGLAIVVYFASPGAYFIIKQCGPFKGAEGRIEGPGVGGIIVASIAIVALAVLEWYYVRADYEIAVHAHPDRFTGRMTDAVRIVLDQHLVDGTDLSKLAIRNQMEEAELFAALLCCTRSTNVIEESRAKRRRR